MNKAKKSFFIETFGCQMNVNDSEKVAGLLAAEGYETAASQDEADFVFVNTCAVREKAADKLKSALGHLKGVKRRRPGVRIGVGGCVAQLEGRSILERAPHVDVLVGTHSLARVPEFLRQPPNGSPLVDLDRRSDRFAIPAEAIAHSSPYRAYVTIMEGCNHVCSFCVVPRTRGPEVCRRPEQVVAETRALVARGVPEVMLLGQTVNACSCDGCDFVDLLARLDALPGLHRLRFTTSHPSHMTERVARRLGSLRRLMPYIHLPVQSGSDRVLAHMRRGYTAAQYAETAERLRDAIPGLALSSDVIVGYPGETPAEFEATLDLLERVGFDGLFSFAYSPRPWTTAQRVADDVPEQEKRRRLRVVNEVQQRRQAERNRARVGCVEDVLVEQRGADGRLFGRSPHFRIVHFEGGDELLGRVARVEITGAGANALVGQRAASDSLTGSLALPIF
jgi:tRNA-2-methylthio-N6-dimethylallyladenosine synthase